MAAEPVPNTLAGGQLAEPAAPAVFGKHAGIVHALLLRTAGAIEYCDDDVDCKVQLGCDSGDRDIAVQIAPK